MAGLQIDTEVTACAKVPTFGGVPPSYNFVLTVDPDSPRNKQAWGTVPPNGQIIMNGIGQLPHGFGQRVTVTIGDGPEPPQVATSGRVPASQRPPAPPGK